jgi:DNA-binding NarL/FixJ family response regulator
MESSVPPQCMARPTTILLVTSGHVGWTHVRQVLANEAAIHVVGDVVRADEAVRLAQLRRPDLVLVAANIVGAGLRDLVHGLEVSSPGSRVVVVTEVFVGVDEESLEPLSVNGVIAWQSLEGNNLLRALEAVLVGFSVTSPELSGSHARSRQSQGGPEVRLTDIEERVLTGLLADRNQQQIAEDAAVGIRTVRRAASRVKRKYQVRTLWGMVRQAVERGYRRDAGAKH